jgi:hypothetical protein
MDNNTTVFVDPALGPIEIADECVYFLKSTAQAAQRLLQPILKSFAEFRV